MTREEIGTKINPKFPGVYAITTAPTKLFLKDGTFKIGFFEPTPLSHELEKDNKYTFIEFGENANKYRTTGDANLAIVVKGDDIVDVEYPAYTDLLLSKLNKLRALQAPQNIDQTIDYKQEWVADIQSLQNFVVHNWLTTYIENHVLEISILPIQRADSYVGTYITSILEMTFAQSQIIILEPVSSVTSEYDGRLDLYMRGQYDRRYHIFRNIIGNKNHRWILAKSSNPRDYYHFDKQHLEKIINDWIE